MVTTLPSSPEDADKHWSPSLQGGSEMQSQLSFPLTSGSARQILGNVPKTKALKVQSAQASCCHPHTCSHGCYRPMAFTTLPNVKGVSSQNQLSTNPASILLFSESSTLIPISGSEIQNPTLSPLGLGGASRL